MELTEDDVDDALKIADKTGNGVIDYDEFIQFVLLDLEGEGGSSGEARGGAKDSVDFSIPAGVSGSEAGPGGAAVASSAAAAPRAKPSAPQRMRKAAHVSIRGGSQDGGGPSWASAAAAAADADADAPGTAATASARPADDRQPPRGPPGLVEEDGDAEEPLPGLRAALLPEDLRPPPAATAGAAVAEREAELGADAGGGRGQDGETSADEDAVRLPAGMPRRVSPISPRPKPVRSAMKKRP